MKPLGRGAAAVILLALAVGSSRADDSMIYYHVGAWDAFSGTTDQGQAFCGIGTTLPTDGRSLSMRFDIGGDHVQFSLGKPSWSIPPGTKMTVVMQVGSETPWTERAEGDGRRVRWPMDQAAVQTFDLQFRRASSVTLTFPDGNEPPWTLSLAGSTAIDNTFGRCITDLTRQASAPASLPSATQPFSRQPTPAEPSQPNTQPTQPGPPPTQPGTSPGTPGAPR